MATRARNQAASDLAHLVHPLTDHSLLPEAGPLVIARGEGCELVAADGRRLIDGSAGLWTVNLGHGRQDLIDAATRQMSTLAYAATFGGVSSPPAIELAERIAGLAPDGLSGVFFVSGGSEANETAIKLARRHWVRDGRPEKSIVIAHDRGYHGLAGVTTTVTRLAPYHADFGAAAPNVVEVPAPYPYRCAAGVPCDVGSCPVCTGVVLESEILRLGADRVAAVIVEPVFGSGGVIVPPPGYLRRLREVCDRQRVLLIVDEVITGFGRTGSWFAVEHENVVPDIVTFAKGVSSGYLPLGGVVVNGRVSEPFWGSPDAPVLRHGQTYSGHPTCCAAALANLDILERENLVARGRELEGEMRAALEPLADHPLVAEVRAGVGLLAAVELAPEAISGSGVTPMKVFKQVREHGVIVRPLGSSIAISPPLTAAAEHFPLIAAAIASGLDELGDGAGSERYAQAPAGRTES